MQNTNNQSKVFDVKTAFFEKNPALAKWIPGFIVRYLRKIVHEDLINQIINEYGHLQGFDFSKAMIEDRFNITINTKGEENLPDSGKYIFVSNHPLGGFDGHIIMYLIGKKYGSYKFLVNDLLMKLKNLHGVFLPVNTFGRQNAELAKKVDEAFNSEAQILTFPSGMVSRKINGQVMDLPWQKNFVTKAKQFQRDVIPLHVSGSCSRFFYRLYSFRKFFGIKANIEMLYLIDETAKHENGTFTVTFGKPIPWQTFDTSKRPIEWAKWVKEQVYKLVGVDSVPL